MRHGMVSRPLFGLVGFGVHMFARFLFTGA
jgi:hypothetical protein